MGVAEDRQPANQSRFAAVDARDVRIVDDEQVALSSIKRLLRRRGFSRVEVCSDGREAIRVIKEKDFDIVLLDLLMPEMDGFEVLEHMKADGALQHIPVIVVSAADEMDSVVRCIEMGATDHLAKPFDPVLLRARINASLAAKRLHDREQAYLEA